MLPIYSVSASANKFGFLFCHEYLDLFDSLLGCKPVRLNKDEPSLLCSNETNQDHSDDLFLNVNMLERHAFQICRCDDDDGYNFHGCCSDFKYTFLHIHLGETSTDGISKCSLHCHYLLAATQPGYDCCWLGFKVQEHNIYCRCEFRK